MSNHDLSVEQLISKANDWDIILNYVQNTPYIKVFWDTIVEECARDQYFGTATMLCMVYNRMMQAINDAADDVLYLEDQLREARETIKQLEIWGGVQGKDLTWYK